MMPAMETSAALPLPPPNECHLVMILLHEPLQVLAGCLGASGWEVAAEGEKTGL